MANADITKTDPDQLARTVFIFTMVAAALFITVTLFAMDRMNPTSEEPNGGDDVSVWALQQQGQ